MAVGTDMTVILAPNSSEEDSPRGYSDYEWTYLTHAREGHWSTLELEWGRALGSPPFEVEIYVNGTLVTSRIPPEIDTGGYISFERIYVHGMIRDSDSHPPNRLLLRSTLVRQEFIVRSISAIFWQDF